VTRGGELRAVLSAPGCAMAVGAHDPVTAKLVARAGVPVVYVSGSASAAVVGGMPDVGLLTFTEMAEHARQVVAATELPTLCDVDTGFGGIANVIRTVRAYEELGAAGVHMEDQVFPKRCGQTDGAQLEDVAQMQQKIAAAKDAQASADFVLIARTDARQTGDIGSVVHRCRAYVAAGADAVFPEALLTREEFARVREEVDAPLVIDIPEWGRSPTLALAELEELGWNLGIYAVSPLRVALHATREFLSDLTSAGTQTAWLDRMVSRDELADLLGLDALRASEDDLARRFPGKDF
jgi:methylisocitrate lyase